MGCTETPYYYNFYYRQTELLYNCINGYNYYYQRCCDHGWITFMWWMIGIFCVLALCCILMAIKRKQMQRRRMLMQNVRNHGACDVVVD